MTTLAECLEHGPLSEKDGLAIARGLTAALDEAHAKGLVHGNLQPADINIMGDGTIGIANYGRATPGPGTAAYLSPEQVRAEAFDQRADVWAVGIVLFEMLSGRPPFVGATAADTTANILQTEPDWYALPVSTEISTRRVLIRCLQKDPQRRPRGMRDVRADLDDAPASLK